jgi:hypothetical protein
MSLQHAVRPVCTPLHRRPYLLALSCRFLPFLASTEGTCILLSLLISLVPLSPPCPCCLETLGLPCRASRPLPLPFLCCSRAEAGKVELDGATYAGFDLPFSITQLVWIEAILVGGAEIYRNTELDPERRLYPGEEQRHSP